MAIPLEEYNEIFAQMPKTGKGDNIELSEEEKAELEKSWSQLDREKAQEKEAANQAFA